MMKDGLCGHLFAFYGVIYYLGMPNFVSLESGRRSALSLSILISPYSASRSTSSLVYHPLIISSLLMPSDNSISWYGTSFLTICPITVTIPCVVKIRSLIVAPVPSRTSSACACSAGSFFSRYSDHCRPRLRRASGLLSRII